VDSEERLDEGFALGEPGAELAAPFSARPDDVLEAHAAIGEFLVRATRGSQGAKELLGPTYGGIVGSACR